MLSSSSVAPQGRSSWCKKIVSYKFVFLTAHFFLLFLTPRAARGVEKVRNKRKQKERKEIREEKRKEEKRKEKKESEWTRKLLSSCGLSLSLSLSLTRDVACRICSLAAECVLLQNNVKGVVIYVYIC